jgi:hypothetical protein
MKKIVSVSFKVTELSNKPEQLESKHNEYRLSTGNQGQEVPDFFSIVP